MSAAQIPPTPESRLEALQCHFTWDLDADMLKLTRIRDKLEDIGTDEANCWLGHIQNLQGFIQYQLGSVQEARRFFGRAAEAFGRVRSADRGPWLEVNYGNLAWLHHLQGEEEEREAFLSKVDGLMTEFPPPSPDELHPEVCAEKAWTLMKFGNDQRLQAADLFQKAIDVQPDRVEWRTSRVLALLSAYKHSDQSLDPDFLQEMRLATENDPENRYLAVHYLEQRAKSGEHVEDEALELAGKISANPVGSYGGMKALTRLFKQYVSVDEAVNLTEETLRTHPDERYLKRCAALCYKWKIVFVKDGRPTQAVFDRAIALHKEVIELYPDSSLVKKVDLANIYAKSRGGLEEAETIYRQLLEAELQPADQQMIYNNYARFMYFERRDQRTSIRYHEMTAAIPNPSFFRENSVKALERIKQRRSQMDKRVQRF
ncbi:interferon-induced protein with tetratricopeptide repeats 1-like [Embiotoca jacksoni]|uniref:interferon-induced protein with tetratricopeptide repeats 1-like n=1 Tax=Embiotoca jacksoni TaxID=100190 RepID=UPI003703BD9F